jgi:hypothetical protein
MKRRKNQKGQALLESCLVLLPLLLIMIGIADFAQFLFFHEALTDRARAGARYAAVNTYDATAITNMVLYNSPTVPSGGTPLFGMTASNVTVTPTPSTGTPTYVQVKISGYPINMISPYLVKSYTHRPIIATRFSEASFGAPN